MERSEAVPQGPDPAAARDATPEASRALGSSVEAPLQPPPDADADGRPTSRVLVVAFVVCLVLLVLVAGQVAGAGLPVAECGGP
jgi:hypothetical protein